MAQIWKEKKSQDLSYDLNLRPHESISGSVSATSSQLTQPINPSALINVLCRAGWRLQCFAVCFLTAYHCTA